MVDINLLREDPEKFRKATAAKQIDPGIIDKVLEIDGARKELILKVENLRGERNKFAKEKNIEEGKRVKVELQKLEPELTKVEEDFRKAFWNVPNLIASDVVIGKDETENEVIRTWGTPRDFNFNPKDHL